MRWVNPMLVVYGLLLIVLGAYGYIWPLMHPSPLHKPSIISLIAGGICGLIVLFTVWWHAKSPRAARIVAAVIALLMIVQMGPKAVSDPKWHTVTIAGSSLIVLILLVSAHFMAMSAKKSASA
jgi:hypothetical protein